MSATRPFVHLFASSLVALAVAGCSAKDAPAAPTTFGLTFPSTAAAVASDRVDIQVFDADTLENSNLCEDLLSDVRSGQSLPATVTDSGSVSTCALLAGTSGHVTVSVGARAFLATTTTHGGSPLLVGCAIEDVAGGQLLVPIDMVLISDTAPVPATTCADLSTHCASKC